MDRVQPLVPIDLSLESVDVLSISLTLPGELDIVLESPSGHQSWLAKFMMTTMQTTRIGGSGRSSTGTSPLRGTGLKVRDSVTGSNSGTLNSWELIFHGVGMLQTQMAMGGPTTTI